MRPFLITILTTLMLFGCSSSDDISLIDDDYLIFGHFYGECIGEGCIETFKLTSNALYEDTVDSYAGSAPFNFEQLENDRFEAVKDLIDFFPSQLISENNDVLGCPDCADGGGIFIEYSKNEIIKSWRIDQSKSNIPTYLHQFVDKVNEKISLINN